MEMGDDFLRTAKGICKMCVYEHMNIDSNKAFLFKTKNALLNEFGVMGFRFQKVPFSDVFRFDFGIYFIVHVVVLDKKIFRMSISIDEDFLEKIYPENHTSAFSHFDIFNYKIKGYQTTKLY
jgi:hypothetical protein